MNKNFFMIVVTVMALLFPGIMQARNGMEVTSTTKVNAITGYRGYDISSPEKFKAKNTDEVAIVTTGTGADLGKAVDDALRTAVKKVYSNFVSADTSLIADSISTMTCTDLRNHYFINAFIIVADYNPSKGVSVADVKSIVGIPKLVDFATSNGKGTEFAGAAFGRKMKIIKFEKQNEADMFNEVLKQVKVLLPLCFKPVLSISEPKVVNEDLTDENGGFDPYFGSYAPTPETIVNAFMGIPSNSEPLKEKQKRRALLTSLTNYFKKAPSCYMVKAKITYNPTFSKSTLQQLIINNLLAFSLSDQDLEQYRSYNVNAGRLVIEGDLVAFYNDRHREEGVSKFIFRFRNDNNMLLGWVVRLLDVYSNYIMNFAIKDNLGTVSKFKSVDVFSPKFVDNTSSRSVKGDGCFVERSPKTLPAFTDENGGWKEDGEVSGLTEGVGLFSPYVEYSMKKIPYYSDWVAEPTAYLNIPYNDKDFEAPYVTTVEASFLIPTQDIEKYTNFQIVNP